eukprot:2676019-Ditylum_brightwellii.AAC.1
MRQNITNAQGAYATTKNLLQGNVLTAFENMEGNNGPQTLPNYKQTIKGMHLHMFPLQAYIMQTHYMCRVLIEPFKMSTCNFIIHVNKINKILVQFPPRDDRTPQEKLVNYDIIDILENTMPRSWQEEIQRQQFDCVAKGQAKLISFCKNLKSMNTWRTARPRRKDQ